MKILITGASGLLGYAFAQAAKRRQHEIIPIVGSYQQSLPALQATQRVDLRDPIATERFLLDQFPDAIVNCAAISDPQRVEQDLDESHRINVGLPEQLAQLSRHLFASFIHISSEQVFDGRQALYHLSDKPSPLNTYGQQKAESEQRVREAAEEHSTVLRIPLLNGNSPRGDRSFHERLMHAWSQGKTTPLFEDEFRQPCLVDNLAAAMVELCERSETNGIFHWAGSQVLSRHEMGSALLRHLGLPEALAKPSLRTNSPNTANRQARLALDLQPLAAKLRTRPQTFDEQLDSLIIPHALRTWYNAI